MTASLDAAQTVLSAAQQAGFRESGIMSLGDCPMVAVRSTGLSLDSIIAFEDSDGQLVMLVDDEYLRMQSLVVNDRFATNSDRIQRFQAALLHKYASLDTGTRMQPNTQWEDAASRRERKREEGMKRQQEIHSLQATQQNQSASYTEDETGVFRDVFDS